MYFLGSYLPIERITSRLYDLVLHWLLHTRTLLLMCGHTSITSFTDECVFTPFDQILELQSIFVAGSAIKYVAKTLLFCSLIRSHWIGNYCFLGPITTVQTEQILRIKFQRSAHF